MFDNFTTKHPRLHSVFLISILPGVILSWFIFIIPFTIYDSFVEDFRPYFQAIKGHWNKK